MKNKGYTLQLRDGDPLIAWDPALQTIHVAAFKLISQDRQLYADDSINVIGVSAKGGVFHLGNGSDTSVVRTYQGVVRGTLYKLYVWDTLERFNDLLKTL